MAAETGAGPAAAETMTAAAETMTAPTLHALYVGDIDPQVTEAQLIAMFFGFQGFVSASLIKSSINSSSVTINNDGAPRCYAYVNFTAPQQARQAMEATNHRVINGKAIRVMEAQLNSEARTSGIGNIFVKNLHHSIDNAKLEEIFAKYGRILSCKVTVSEDGSSKGYGFVQFESPESASLAIESVNDSIVEGQKLYVSKFMRKEERFSPENPNEFHNLYFKNLDDNVNEEMLQDKFAEFGEITSFLVAKDDDGKSRGFGFVNFKETTAARQAQQSMNGIQLGSKRLYVARAQRKSERRQLLRQQSEWLRQYKDCNLYVKNIHVEANNEQLRDHFSTMGNIIETRIMRDENGVSKGFGFVCFSTVDEASKSVHLLNGSLFHGKPLYVAVAQSKEERRCMILEAIHARRNTAPVPPPFPFPPLAVPPFFPPPPFLRQQRLPFRPPFPPMSAGLPFRQPPLPGNYAGRRPSMPFPPRVCFNCTGTVFRRPVMPHPPPQVKEADWSSSLAAASPDRREEMIWGRLFPLVQRIKGDLAPRITEILMELDDAERLVLLESEESLVVKVEEAERIILLTKN